MEIGRFITWNRALVSAMWNIKGWQQLGKRGGPIEPLQSTLTKSVNLNPTRLPSRLRHPIILMTRDNSCLLSFFFHHLRPGSRSETNQSYISITLTKIPLLLSSNYKSLPFWNLKLFTVVWFWPSNTCLWKFSKHKSQNPWNRVRLKFPTPMWNCFVLWYQRS